MNKNTKTILLSELYAATGYSERLFHALLDVTDLGRGTAVKLIGERLFVDLNEFFTNKVYGLHQTQSLALPSGLLETQQLVDACKCAMEAQVKMSFHPVEILVPNVVEFINLLYSYAHEFHEILSLGSDLEIQLPRVNLIEIHYKPEETIEEHLSPYQEVEEEWDDLEVPTFTLDVGHVLNVLEDNIGEISSLEWQRNKKYEEFLKEGHDAVFKQDQDKALDKFLKALNYKETAEILTLIGWAHSMKKNFDDAKSYCLKAIKLDPNYGPPYNDLGSYLLTEGQTGESLKWFELAKKATNYQNREYPYINAGRAYMARNEYELALNEFSKALTLAPFHEELHVTVEKLKKSLKKKDKSSLDKQFDEMPPTL
jgi:tetratricopeptide (TPR) repeat protein